MEVNITNKEDYLREAVVKIESSKVQEKIEELLGFYQDKISMPGFRVGKVPKDIFYRKLGKGIESLATEQLIREAFQDLKEKYHWQVLGEPRVSDIELTENKDLQFTLFVEILPEFELKEYKEIPVKKRVITGFEKEFERKIKELQKKCATYITVTRPAKYGDFLFIDYKEESGKEEINKVIELGNHQNHPQINEELVGVKAGEERTIKIVFEKDYPNKNFAGKEVVYHIKIRSVKEQHLPEISDSFAQDLGYENLSALKEEIENEIMREREMILEQELRRQVIDYLIANYDFTPPPSLVNFAYQTILAQLEKKEEISSEWEAAMKEEAKNRAKLSCLLQRIAEKEKIAISEEEVNKSIRDYQDVLTPETAADLMKNDYLKKRLLEEKTLNWLIEHAKIIEEV